MRLGVHPSSLFRRAVVTLAAVSIAAGAGSALRDPDVRVDVNEGLFVSTSKTRAPRVFLDGPRLYAAYIDRRYFTGYDALFNVSVNQGGSWRSGDQRLNTQFPPGWADGGSMETVVPASDASGRVYVMMLDDILGQTYVHVSPDGGESWPGDPRTVTANDADPLNPWLTRRAELLIGGDGVAHVVWEDNRSNPTTGYGSVRLRSSFDAGTTWGGETLINIDDGGAGQTNFERATEPAACAAGGRLYVAFRDKRDPNPLGTLPRPGRILFRYSADNGQSFQPPGAELRLDAGDTAMTESAAPALACGGADRVMAAWQDQRAGDWDIFFAASTDGGQSFGAEQRIDDGAAGTDATRPRLVLADPAATRIYAAWEDARDGGVDLYFSHSEDGGATWAPSQQLNTGVTPGSVPVENWDIDADGTAVTVAWVDNRNGPVSPPARDVFVVRSLDGGASFDLPERVDLGTIAGSADSMDVDLAVEGAAIALIYRDDRNDPGNSTDFFSGGTGMSFDPLDPDADGYVGDADNCPNYPNPSQVNDDYDNRGNLCDPFPKDPDDDSDADGVSTLTDNCPDNSNLLQEDDDLDGFGNACDGCPLQADTTNRDLDGDKQGDTCDPDIDGDGLDNTADADDDNDGIDDISDNCPVVPNPLQLSQNDGDAEGDACDLDDGVVQGLIVEPRDAVLDRGRWDSETGADSYNVYFGFAARLKDGDPGYCYRAALPVTRALLQDAPDPGKAFWYLVTSLSSGSEGGPGRRSDGAPRPTPPVCDAAAATDWDQDGAQNHDDNCVFDANPGQADLDGDGVGDVCDAFPGDRYDDRQDGDGVGGDVDNCPLTPNPDQADADADGVGDVCDACPLNFDPQQLDGDGDGLGDACDGDIDGDGLANGVDDDRDGDGVPNVGDNCADTANADQADLNDGDGVGDACDIDDGEIGGVRIELAHPGVLQWSAETGASGYAVYADSVTALSSGGVYGNCLVPKTPTVFAEIPATPAPGQATYYLVTGFFSAGEGTAGRDSAGSPRGVPGACE